jgi:hypothetical protein
MDAICVCLSWTLSRALVDCKRDGITSGQDHEFEALNHIWQIADEVVECFQLRQAAAFRHESLNTGQYEFVSAEDVSQLISRSARALSQTPHIIRCLLLGQTLLTQCIKKY